MKETQVVIVGGGPAGLAAGIEIAKSGGQVTVLDENKKPGGQLFKQIHKFFGSREHLAGTRGYEIGTKLLEETKELGVDVILDAPVYGIFEGKTVVYSKDGKQHQIKGDKIILATGATENTLAFPGSDLPGVMGAGAAQTMINVNRVLPGKKVLMVGSGNVGLIVSYQLMQAGADVVGLVEAAPNVSGYGVHASKISRGGVPIYTSHTVKRAMGDGEVSKVEICELDDRFQMIEGTEKILDVDTICIAVGLSPMSEIAWTIGCDFTFIPTFGGHVPKHNENMESTIPGIYVSGDISGVEEASSAMEEGRLAGIAASESLGLYSEEKAKELKGQVWNRLNTLRDGEFGEKRKQSKNVQINRYMEDANE